MQRKAGVEEEALCNGASWHTCSNVPSLTSSPSSTRPQDSTQLSWLLPVSLLLLLLVAIVVMKLGGAGGLYGERRRRRKVPPGSIGLPLGIGETLQFAFYNTCRIGTPPPFLSSRLHKYGTVFKTHLIGRPTVVSMDPELNKLLLSNEEKLVQVNFPSFIKKIVGPVLTVHGARHRRLRELATTILSPAAIQTRHLIPVQEYAQVTLSSWLHMPIVDAQHESKKFIFTYIVKMLLSLAPEDPKTELLMRDYLFLMTGYSALPLNLPGTTYRKVLKARERIMTIFRRLLRARLKVVRVEPKDFVDVLLKETDECGKPFTEQDMLDFIYFLVLGGFETTSIVLTNVIKFLSENAHVVDELRKEHTYIRRNKKANEMLSWDDFKQMQFTDFVIKEALRMASVVHYVTREALQDISFKDMVIPKGWAILINFAMVHLSSSHYKNPLKFDPWRWKDTENNNQAFLMPFGGGIRSCLGSVLAKFEVSIFIHYLVTSYKLFLLGLEKFGKGDWKSISRNFVITRTATQVASHAQKFFIRRNSMPKEKRRSSIHDITSTNNSEPSQTGHTTPAAGSTPSLSAHQPSVVPVGSAYGVPVGQPITTPLISAVGTPVPLVPAGSIPYIARPHILAQPVVSGVSTSMVPVTYPMHPSAK